VGPSSETMKRLICRANLFIACFSETGSAVSRGDYLGRELCRLLLFAETWNQGSRVHCRRADEDLRAMHLGIPYVAIVTLHPGSQGGD
jgi:hypothetical protein